MTDQPLQVLQNVFGYDEFRSHQEAIIHNVLCRNDTLAIMPTGGGKSICYQIPALIFPGLTLVISPLISLMEDQVDQLQALGVEAALLNSTLTSSEYQSTVSRVHSGVIKLLYMAPETLMLDRTQHMLTALNVDCLTIDEAHCISEWGHDFRPEYRQLAAIRRQFPNAVCVALTATATPRVQQDIKNILHMSDSNEFIASFNRTNLFLQISDKKNPLGQTFELIDRFKNQSGIIYCNSRRQVDELTQVLKESDCSVAAYHARLSSEVRTANQAAFIRDDIQVIVATVAFGMGINKPNVRFVLHYDMPQNIESYYQQIGRAGRDGLPAHCQFLFGYGDIQKIKFFINQKAETEQRVANQHLNALISFAEAEECRRVPLLHYFGEAYSEDKCHLCDNCLSEDRPLIDVSVPAQKFLSCVYRTGQMFGASHLADILRGSKAKKIIEKQHDQLPVYGIGMELAKSQWLQLSRNLIQKGFIIQDSEFGSLKLTSEARPVLKGEQTVEIRLAEKQEKTEKSHSKKQTDLDYNHDLFEQLRVCRKDLADQANVPPYVIFSDKTLVEISAYYPQSKESLLQMSGVGSVKLEQYGDTFLQVITDFCQQRQIKEVIKAGRKNKIINESETSKATTKQDARHVVIGKSFSEGMMLEEILKEYKLKIKTLLSHLYKYQIEVGDLPKTDAFVKYSELTPDKVDKIVQSFHEHSTERLRPVYDDLNETVSYDQLHLIRLHYLVQDFSRLL
ncbi:ATP-dependent DNA helicase RecQ [Endozoicomonas sp. (ex Bugula neritina AB1)]|nr:ATP-dependent DNA helicase RecQ [Endozoicomonas sp. (ex Bugula neritina AB1)]